MINLHPVVRGPRRPRTDKNGCSTKTVSYVGKLIYVVLNKTEYYCIASFLLLAALLFFMGWSLYDPNGPGSVRTPLRFSVWDFWRIWPMSMEFIPKSQEEIASVRINMGWTSDTQRSLAAKSKESASKTYHWHMYSLCQKKPTTHSELDFLDPPGRGGLTADLVNFLPSLSWVMPPKW